jgi:hypothetical protein
VRRECEREPLHPRQLRAEAARPQQRDRDIAPLSGNRFHQLPWSLRAQVALQFGEERWKIVATLLQISS